MKVIIQCVNNASVTIDNKIHNKIQDGYLMYVGFTHDDNQQTVDKYVSKIAKLRINPDENGKININGIDADKEVLSISQFTLYANVKSGNRPSFTDAMLPSEATKLYDYFNQQLANAGFVVRTGVFGADMLVESVNNGPLTFIMDL